MSRIGLVFLLLSLTFFVPNPAVAQTFSTPGSWSYTVPAGVTRVQVQVSGGGGGGGAADSAKGGNGGNGAKVTAIITVTPGQVLSGTIGQGGGSAFTSGATSFGYVPCTGKGAGGTGRAAGGNGAAANCPGVGYSGSGAGGGGSSSLAVNGVVFIQAGGGGGAGAGSAVGQNGTTSLVLTSTSSCATSVNGGNATAFNGDAGGGGGGGGGFTAGAGGSSVNDFTSAIAGGGGGSCQHNSADISSTSIAATGGTGAMGRTARSSTAGSPGSNGSVVITPGPLEVQKTSVVTSDAVSGANPKFLPGATIRYCVFIRNNWGGNATNVVLTDSLPTETSIVANSFNKGTTCADATNNEPQASVAGSTVIANIGALATSASYALVFQVTLN